MAFRIRAPRGRYRRPTSRAVKKPYGGSKSRRSYRKKRTYRKRKSPRKAILNLTSTKKRNTMLQYANTSSVNGTSVNIGPGPYLVNGATGGFSIFCPTAMDLTEKSGANNSVVNAAERNSTTCFMRGYSEDLRVQTSTGVPWFWRRITFCSKSGVFGVFASADTPTQTNGGETSYTDTSNGMERIWFNQNVNSAPNTVAGIQAILFKGQFNKDWVDPLTAPLDTSRVDVRSDVTKCIRSGNASGTVMQKKCWYPMNKNLVYDDDEAGESEVSTYTTVVDKRGMGDYFIIDIFAVGTGGGTADLLQVTSTSSMYWHEK
ncbi:putative capsid protein [Spider associated circular virus 1]|uniref:Putative capsid protein n=1 Tax=Spider associated circular virus 1 TaxID=2293302 RepID=A0A346BP75_9VIRU|nr:putative capsid protein [Spider associated circular virus 1]